MVSTIPSSAVYLGTFNRKLTAHGDASAEVQYKIAEADWEAMRLFLLRTALSDDTLLGCNEVEEDPLGKDPNNGTILVTAKYIPWMKILWGTVNFPFHGDWEAHAEAFTISGCLFWQSDGTPLMNRQAKPALKVMCRKLVLKGVRSATALNFTFYNQSSLDALAGCINSDDFLGYAPGQALFETYSGASRPYDDGSMVYDVSATVLIRDGSYGGSDLTWNTFWREDTSAFDTLVSGSADGPPIYTPAALTPLLSL